MKCVKVKILVPAELSGRPKKETKTMKTKTSKLTLYPVSMVGLQEENPYEHVYCNEKYSVFAGRIPETPSTEVIIFEGLEDIQVLSLQMILSYGRNVKKMLYCRQLQRIIVTDVTLTIPEIARFVCAGVKWICEILKIDPRINVKEMPAANAYTLSRKILSQEDFERFNFHAKTLRPLEFIPLMQSFIRERKLK